MVPLCRHIHPDGRQCGSPAVRDQLHCHFHEPGRRPTGTRRRTTRPGYRWYSLNRRVHKMSEPEILPAFAEVIAADLDGRITPRRAVQLYNRLSIRGQRLHPEPHQ